MKRLRLCLIFIIPLALFGPAGLVALPGAPQEQKRQKAKESAAPLGCEDRTSQGFYENLSIIPIKFLSKSKNNETLTGLFVNPMVADFRRFEFKLTPEKKDEKGLFFQVDGEWEEEIGRKVFLKKFKNDFWLVMYLVNNRENIICEAHQFKDWEALRASYAQGKGSHLVDIPKFWENLKVKLVYFYNLDAVKKDSGGLLDDGAYWVSVVPTDGLHLPEDEAPVKLEGGKLVNRITKFPDGTEVRIVDHGIFLISDDSVFHTLELKNPKLPRVKLANIELGMLKIRSRPVDKKYFVENLKNSAWLCFYDSENYKLLRVVEASYSEEGTSKNGQSDNNAKNGKIQK